MSFKELFRQARVKKGSTLREISTAVGISIGYLSDIEHGRRKPPASGIISQIETILNIKDGVLIKAASKERLKGVSPDVKKIFDRRPEKYGMLLRVAENLTEEQLNEAIEQMGKRGGD